MADTEAIKQATAQAAVGAAMAILLVIREKGSRQKQKQRKIVQQRPPDTEQVPP